MSKADALLEACKKNLNQWTCAYCASNSNQPASTFRELKKKGYQFEEVSPGRWGRTLFCDKCGTERSHYKLLFLDPQFPQKERITIDKKTRKRVLELFNYKYAFSGASISSTPEIDHKIPWTRLNNDIDPSGMSDKEIIEHFQLLTREHNLLKDRMCTHCKTTCIRPSFFGINFWYSGDENYRGSCVGCGWFDGKKWKDEINKSLNMNNND